MSSTLDNTKVDNNIMPFRSISTSSDMNSPALQPQRSFILHRIGSEPNNNNHTQFYDSNTVNKDNTQYTVIQHIDNISGSSSLYLDEQYVNDVTVDFLYKPHTILAAVVFISFMIYFAFIQDDNISQLNNLRIGVTVSVSFFLILGLLIFPSGPFIRPHPLVWRLAFGIAVLYEMLLIGLLFQTKNDVRQFLKFFYPELGK